MMVALAWPPPSHIVCRPYRPPVRSQLVQRAWSSGSRRSRRAGGRARSRRRSGWSSPATAPVSCAQAIGTGANASLTSNTSMSSTVRPGPGQRLLGGRDRPGQHEHRVVAGDGQRVRSGPAGSGRAACTAASEAISTRAGAVGDLRRGRRGDLPALAQRRQPGHLLQRGVPARPLVVRRRPSIGAISRSNRPSSMALTARWWLSSANSSSASRLMPHFSHISWAPRNWEISWSPYRSFQPWPNGSGHALLQRQPHRRAHRHHAHALHARPR